MNVELFLLGGAYGTQAIDGFTCLWDCETFTEFKKMCGVLLEDFTWNEDWSVATCGSGGTRFLLPSDEHLQKMFERVVSYRSEE